MSTELLARIWLLRQIVSYCRDAKCPDRDPDVPAKEADRSHQHERKVGIAEKLIFLRLAEAGNEFGQGVWPSYQTVCLDTGLAVRTCQAIINQAIENGLLVVDK